MRRELKIIATGLLIWCAIVSVIALAYITDRVT